MESLPDVVLRKLGKYLTGQELAKWSAVNHWCREKLNENIFWRHRCDLELAEYLKNTESQVEPIFVSPEIEGSGLRSICEWRLCFMREVHLQNNWRNHRHTAMSLPSRRAFVKNVSFDQAVNFLANDFIITHTDEKIEIWNVNKSFDMLCSESLLSNVEVSYFQLFGDKLIVGQNHVYQVFKISIADKKIVFLHSFDYRSKEKNILKSYKRYRVSQYDIPKEQTTMVHNILVVLDQSQNTLHVWNIETGEKLKEEQRADVVFKKMYCHDDSDQSYLCVGVEKTRSRDKYLVVIYDVPDFTEVFLLNVSSYAGLPCRTIVVNDCVIIDHGEPIQIYDLQSKDIVLTIEDVEYDPFRSIQAGKDYVVLVLDDHVVGKFSTSLKTYQTFHLENEPLSKILIVDSRYILLGLGDYYDAFDGDYFLAEIKGTDIHVIKELFTGSKYFCFNQTKTKMLARSPECQVSIEVDDEDGVQCTPERAEVVTFW